MHYSQTIALQGRRLTQEAQGHRAHTAAMIERVRAQQTASAAAATEVGSLRARLAVIEQVCVCYMIHTN
jgi:hypothetical protein